MNPLRLRSYRGMTVDQLRNPNVDSKGNSVMENSLCECEWLGIV